MASPDERAEEDRVELEPEEDVPRDEDSDDEEEEEDADYSGPDDSSTASLHHRLQCLATQNKQMSSSAEPLKMNDSGISDASLLGFGGFQHSAAGAGQ